MPSLRCVSRTCRGNPPLTSLTPSALWKFSHCLSLIFTLSLPEYPIILLMLQNFLADLPLPVPLESQPVCNYQIPLKRWALTLLSYLWLFRFFLLTCFRSSHPAWFSPQIVVRSTFLLTTVIHWNITTFTSAWCSLLEQRGSRQMFPAIRNNYFSLFTPWSLTQ